MNSVNKKELIFNEFVLDVLFNSFIELDYPFRISKLEKSINESRSIITNIEIYLSDEEDNYFKISSNYSDINRNKDFKIELVSLDKKKFKNNYKLIGEINSDTIVDEVIKLIYNALSEKENCKES